MLMALSRFSIVAACAALICSSLAARADEPEPTKVAPQVERVLAWLPGDTESVVAGSSFKIPARFARDKIISGDADESVPNILAQTALGELFELDVKYRVLVAEKDVAFAIRGNRNYYSASASPPSYNSESCAVIIFEKDLGDTANQLAALLRQGAQETRKIGGRELFAFPATERMRKQFALPSRRDWLGLYIAVADSRTVVCSSSDKYIRQVLDRIESKSDRAAIPQNLDVWKQIRPNAKAWAVWHPKALLEKFGGEPLLNGITWVATPDELRVAYLAPPDESQRFERSAKKLWNDSELLPPSTIETLKDGTVTVSMQIKELDQNAKFLLTSFLAALEAGNVGDSR